MPSDTAAAPRRAFSLSGTGLKRLACLSMLIDHIGASCLENGVLYGTAAADTLSLAPAVPLQTLDLVLRAVGRLAFPIYCFLLVEGFMHTHSLRRYTLRLLVFALVSEIPFDAAFFDGIWCPAYQNVYWTLLAGLLCLAALRTRSAAPSPAQLKDPLSLVYIAAFAAAAELCKTDYGALGVLLIVQLYLYRGTPRMRNLLGCCLTCYEVTAPLAFVPISAYNGQRGRCARWEQYAFYAFYPVHLTALALITHLLLRA